MPQLPDISEQKPSAFARDPEIQDTQFLLLSSAAGYDVASGERLSEASTLKWKGVVAQIRGVGPDHGREILQLLQLTSERTGGISLMTAKAAIEIYCHDYGLAVPAIPENARTTFDGAFSQSGPTT